MADEADTEVSSERDWEGEAQRDGWRPLDEWSGDPDKWVDARTFVERGEEILPIVKARLGRQIEALERKVEEYAQTGAQFREFSEKALARERQEKEKLRAELREARKQAVAEGDADKFDRADEALRKMDENVPPGTSPTQEAFQREVAGWFENHEIYGQNEKAQAMLDGFANTVKMLNPTLSGAALLDKIHERVQREAPELFENPNRRRGDNVENPKGGSGKSNGKGRSFSDLPQDAQAACRDFQKRIPGFTEKQYLENYDWEA